MRKCKLFNICVIFSFLLLSHLNAHTLNSLNNHTFIIQQSESDTIRIDVYDTICRYDLPYFHSNQLFYDEGTYSIPLKTDEEKDSIITLYLSVIEIPERPSQIIGDTIVNNIGNYVYRINSAEDDATEYHWYISNLYWTLSKNNKADTCNLFIPFGGNGILSVTAANQCGTSAATQLFITSTLNVEDYSGETSITLFPNPAQDYVTLSVPENKSYTYSIFDIKGEKINQGVTSSSNTKLSLAHLEKGVYFLQIFEDNHFVKTIKVLKK